MDRDSAVQMLQNLPQDQEVAHGEADDILCEYLRSIGESEVADAFDAASDEIGFWYA